jgi:hypothetical protein
MTTGAPYAMFAAPPFPKGGSFLPVSILAPALSGALFCMLRRAFKRKRPAFAGLLLAGNTPCRGRAGQTLGGGRPVVMSGIELFGHAAPNQEIIAIFAGVPRQNVGKERPSLFARRRVVRRNQPARRHSIDR